MLSNSESWVGLSKTNIKDLESVDEQLLRSIFSSDLAKHAKTPKELLYLETGTIPIRFTIKSRRLNFCWYLLNQDEDSLLGEFFKAQCDSPTRGDWVSVVKQDIEDLELDMTFDQIKACSKEAFKDIVKKHVTTAAFKYLISIQKTHSKATMMEYRELNLQQYLDSECNHMTNREKIFAFTARSHMLNLKCNFKIGKVDLKCSLGCDQDETQKHLYTCPALESVDSQETTKYEDIYGNDKERIRSVSRVLMTKYQQFLEKTTVHGTPKPCAATVNNANIVIV